jgi:C4-dicarboxylate-specific signal transduction histidine kinase
VAARVDARPASSAEDRYGGGHVVSAPRFVVGALLLLGLSLGGPASLTGRAQPTTGMQRDGPTPVPASGTRPAVLVLIPVQPGRLVFDRLTHGVVAEFLRAPGPPVTVFIEYLYDLAAVPDHGDRQLEFVRAKYADSGIGVIIAFEHPDYLRIREPLGLPPDLPIVFGSLHHVARRPSATTLIEVGGDEGDSLARVAPLLPPPNVVAIVGGGSTGDRRLNAGLRQKLERIAPGRVTDLSGVPLREMAARVALLPERSVVVFGTTLADSTGQPITAPMLMSTIAPATHVPIVVSHDLLMGQGVLGGWVYSFEELGQETAKAALAVLNGAKVDDIPARVVPTRPTFDARQLRRFGIDESRLPADARILFREPTRWQTSRPWIIFGVSALIVQTALIFGLVEERRRRRESERLLASRAARQALIADVSSEFATLTHGGVDLAISASLERVGRVLQVSECALWALDGQRDPRVFERWQAEPAPTARLDQASVASVAARLRLDEVVHLDQTRQDTTPIAASGAPQTWSALLLPLRVDGRVMAMLSVVHTHSRAWSAHVADDLRTVGEIVATAVVRKRTEASMRTQLEALAHVNRVAGLGELAASLAHQLNQPLAAILSNAEVAQQLLERTHPPLADVREILGDVIADDERADGIIQHMRTMLKKQHVQPTIVDVNAVVARVTNLVAHDARLRGSSLDVNLGPALPRVRMDATQLKQVLLNLVVNATDAMTAVTSRQPVELRTTAGDGGVLIDTRDHGPGIPPEALQRLFDPFFTTKAEGLGVGLSITRSIVEAAGGRISAHNHPDGGAVFRVWLPEAEAAAEAEPETG